MPRTRLRRFGSRVRSIAAAALCLAAACPAAGELLPDDRRTSWNPGIPGGVPARARTCATIGVASDGRGASDVAREVQTAIDACPPGQVVLLAAGTFVVDGEPLSIRKAVTLRGAGPGGPCWSAPTGRKKGPMPRILGHTKAPLRHSQFVPYEWEANRSSPRRVLDAPVFGTVATRGGDSLPANV